jgi:outer membrane protein assembly factor BamB/fibronectin type 3 domain-containing protein
VPPLAWSRVVRSSWTLGWFIAAAVAAALVLGGSTSSAGGSADWPGYLYDGAHSSYNAAATAIGPSQVASLEPVWRWLDPPIANGGTNTLWSSPTVSNGVIYIGDGDGRLFALRESDQSVLWSAFLGVSQGTTCGVTKLGLVSTATVAPAPGSGTPTVYDNGADGNLYALNAATGAVVWKARVDTPSSTVSDYFAWGSPLVANGKVYVGISSDCDQPLVVAGVAGFDQATGAPIGVWHTMLSGVPGGSVWSTPSVLADGSIVASTGNDEGALQTQWAESIVRLDGSSMSFLDGWQVPIVHGAGDADFGGSPTDFTATLQGASTPMVGACNKNGYYYALRQADMHDGPVWTYHVASPTSVGGGVCLAAAIWDGSQLIVAGGDPTVIGGTTYGGSIRSLDPATGTPRWQTGLAGGIVGSPTEDGAGLIAAPVFVSSTGTYGVYLLRASDGSVVDFIPTPSALFGQPVFADGYLLIGGSSSVGLTAYAVTTPGPALTSVSPSAVAVGQTTTVIIAGSGFSGTTSVWVSGTNVVVTRVQVVSPTKLSISVRPQAGVALGPHNIAVIEPGAVADTCSACLFVQAATATSIGSSASPSPAGSSVTFTATVSPSDGGGSVAFTSDGTTITGCGARPLALVSGSEMATCTTSSLVVGTHTVAAAYTGDSSYSGSNGTLAGGQVEQAVTTTTVGSSANPNDVGYPLTLTATVSPSDGGGLVGFTSDGTTIAGCGAQPLSAVGAGAQATCTTTALTVGTHAIAASFTGDLMDTASNGTLAGGLVIKGVVPGVPTGLAATVLSTTSLTLSWDVVPGATKYFVQQATTPGGPYTQVASPTAASKTVTGLTSGTIYYFVVKANNGYKSSAASSELAASTATVPSAPTGLGASVLTTTSVSLSWNPVAGATRYYVFQATTSGGPYTQVASPTSASKAATGLTPGTTYYFVVKANNGFATSAASNEASAALPAIPAAPTGLSASTASDTSLSLTWNAVAGATRYLVLEATVSGGPYTQVAATTTTTKLVTGLTAATTYYFVVEASNGVATSPASSQASAATAATPAAPVGLSGSAHTSSSVTLSWGTVTGATKYYVYEATVSGGPYTQVAVVSGTNGRTVTGLASGTTYYFVVKAYNGYAFSAASAEASATTS